MERVEIVRNDLTVGKPVSWDVYDRSDRLLLKKGMTVHSLRQIMQLLDMGACHLIEVDPETVFDQEMLDVLSPFDRIATLALNLENVLTLISTEHTNGHNIQQQVLDLCDELIELCETDIDALIGAIHVDEQYRYTVIHPLHTAVLCYIVAQKTKLNIDKTVCLMAAGLTCNVGMFDLQEILHGQAGQLNEEQKRQILDHPKKSALLLKKAGVMNKLWLEVVLQHHEQIDGSGYPRRLQGKYFLKESRILGMADKYHAMISSRHYRKGLTPTQALKQLFKVRGKQIDETVALMFIKEVGIYPPGSFVRLKNGETALVTRRGEDSMKPEVKSLLSANGKMYEQPKLRNTSKSAYDIAGLCLPLSSFNRDLKLLWDYVDPSLLS